MTIKDFVGAVAYQLNMWYKYLNRSCDELRLFRKANLKFNQDDLGMFKNKFIGRFTDLLFRMSRTEATLRGAGLLFLFSFYNVVGYVKSEYYDPVFTQPKLIEAQRKEEENNQKARETLYYNNLGAPTKPTRRMEEFMTFISSNEAINKNFDYLMYGLELNSDQIKGLDSYSTENDERMLELLAESKKKSGGH